MPAESAGLLVHRRRGRGLEVLLVHPGGPFFAKKDDGAWSIPKGVIDPGEDRLDAARREFREETGNEPPSGPLTQLDPITPGPAKATTTRRRSRASRSPLNGRRTPAGNRRFGKSTVPSGFRLKRPAARFWKRRSRC
jgi:hypothetical protein